MAKAFNVSENIGFDGYSYYCRRCGKAGYQKPTQVRGHLAMCRGTLLRKGMPPTTSYNQLPTGNGAGLQNPGANYLQPVRPAYGGNLGGGQLQAVEAVVGPGDYHLVDQVNQLNHRVGLMENEYNHILQERNQPKQESWLTKNMAWIVLGGIMLIALFSAFGQNGCPVPAGGAGASPKRSGPDINKLSERIINKAADTAITKGFGRMFS